MTEPTWLTLGQVLALQARQIERYGGAPGLRDRGALESALDRPKNRWAYGASGLPELAASYAFGLARNHPFVDGNKRAAFLAMAAFLILNGKAFTADPDEATAAMLALAAGSLDEAAIARWLHDTIG